MAKKIVAVLLLLTSLTARCATSSSVEVADSRFGKFDFAELESVLYEPELSATPIRERLVDTLETEETAHSEAEQGQTKLEQLILVSRHRQKYSCGVPVVTTDLQEAASSELPLPNLTALLQPLTKQPCLQQTVRWWTYEYCHGQFVRQYHLEAGKISGKTIYLGYFENETQWDRTYVNKVKHVIDSMKNNVQQYPIAFHTQRYVNGTVCDLTNQPRQTVVKLHCGLEGSDRIVEVQEDETCHYTITVQTSLLCQYPLFDHSPVNPRRKLACSPVLGEAEYQEYLLEQELLEEKQKEIARAKEELKDDPAVRKAAETLSHAVYQSLSQLFRSDEQSSGLFDSGADDSSFSDAVDREEIAGSSKKSQREKVDNGEPDLRMESTVDSASEFEDPKSALGRRREENEEEDAVIEDWESLQTALSDVISQLANQLQDGSHKPAPRKFSVPEGISQKIEQNTDKIAHELEHTTATPPQAHDSSDEHKVKLEDSESLAAEESKDSPQIDGTSTDTLATNSKVQNDRASSSDDRSFLDEIDDDTLDELVDALPSEAFDRMLEDLDEEALQDVLQEVQDEIQERLDQAGLQRQAGIRLKVLPISLKDIAKEDQEAEEDSDSHTGKVETKIVTFTNNPKKTDSTEQALTPAMARLFNELFDDSTSVLTEDRLKQQKLESGYNRTWRKRKKHTEE